MVEDQALERLHEILARPEYHVGADRPLWDQLLAPVWELVTYLVARLIQSAVDAAAGTDGIYGWLALGMSGLLIAGVLVYLVRAVRSSVLAESRLSAATLAERREGSDRLWQTAQQLASAGRLAEAARLVYLSALYALDERELVHVEQSRTNREHARELDHLYPQLAHTFVELVERYDRARYGATPLSATSFAELSALAARSRLAALQSSRA